jgi:hypothetical protein
MFVRDGKRQEDEKQAYPTMKEDTMSTTFKVEDILEAFDNLAPEQQKELLKQLAPKFCEIMMNDKTLMQDMMQGMMPKCMDMMPTMNFPMNAMMATMMGKP